MKLEVLVVGQIVWDHRFWTEKTDRRSGRTAVASYRAALGGPAAVAAVTIESLGGHAVLLGRVGGDTNGDAALDVLREAGVDLRLVERQAGGVTAVSAVVVPPDGERHIYPFPGAFLPSDPLSFPPALTSKAQALLVDSRWPTAAVALAKLARASNVPVVVDLDVDQPDMWEVVRNATFTICDEDLARSHGGTDLLLEHIEQLGSSAAVTRGSNGTVTRSTTVPAFEIQAIDTTGAGDVFHGAFALALAEGQRSNDALVFASASAAVKCSTGRIPTRPEVDSLLRGTS